VQERSADALIRNKKEADKKEAMLEKVIMNITCTCPRVSTVAMNHRLSCNLQELQKANKKGESTLAIETKLRQATVAREAADREAETAQRDLEILKHTVMKVRSPSLFSAPKCTQELSFVPR
jgi:hypothetical protein